MQEIAAVGTARLRDYGGDGTPVVFVPSLINPPFVLDLAPDNSLIRHVARRNRALLIDWGMPTPDDRALDVSAIIETMLLPMLRTLDTPPVLVGYCLGGTIALAAASAMPVAGVALIATPWHFSGFGDEARRNIGKLWHEAEPACDLLGLVPMEVLQSGFWRLDPARTVGKYESFASLEPGSNAAQNFIALEDWANAGAPLPLAAARQMFDRFFTADDPGEGRWTIKGRKVDPLALSCPTVDFVSLTDRIVPAASSARLADRRELGAGHVGMVVGGRARTLLHDPLADWISGLDVTR